MNRLKIRLPRDQTPPARARQRPCFLLPRRPLVPLFLLLLLGLLSLSLYRLPSHPPSHILLPKLHPLDLPPPPLPNLKTLLLVPCHGTYLSGPPSSDTSWALDTFSQNHHRGSTFLSHITTAVELASNGSEKDALVVFSGGETRADAGARSEAAGYLELAEEHLGNNGWGDVKGRAVSEDHAADSWENLVFSICRFYEIVGDWPSRIVVVGFEFKRERWERLHRVMAGWTGRFAGELADETWKYIGIDPDWDEGELEKVKEGEGKVVKMFESDCKQRELVEKRMKRRWGRRRDGYTESCPMYAPWLRRCERDGEISVPDIAPWDPVDEGGNMIIID